jgi:hypothetical protein
MSFSFVEKSANNQTPPETLNIMTYELAMVFSLVNRSNKNSDLSMFIKTEVADFVSMTRMFCEQTGLLFKDIDTNKKDDLSAGRIFIALGYVIQRYHYKKRFGEYSEKGDPQESINILCDYIYSLCLEYHWNYFEVMELGEKRYIDRMRDLVTNGIKSELKKEHQGENKNNGN